MNVSVIAHTGEGQCMAFSEKSQLQLLSAAMRAVETARRAMLKLEEKVRKDLERKGGQ